MVKFWFDTHEIVNWVKNVLTRTTLASIEKYDMKKIHPNPDIVF